MPQNVVTRIRKKLERIAENPYEKYANVTKLKNRPGYRLRVGDWRVIYDIREDKMMILVLNIGSRGEIYR